MPTSKKGVYQWRYCGRAKALPAASGLYAYRHGCLSDAEVLSVEIAMRDELIAGQERELRLQSRLIEEQKEMIEFLQEHISKITVYGF